MSAPLGLLLSCFDFSPVAEDEFHDWYDTEHIPERERVPGFLRLERWISVDRPKGSVTTYDLSGFDVLRSAPYLAIGYENNSPWTRRVGWRCIKLARLEAEQIAPGDMLPPRHGKAILVRAFNLDGALEPELVEWFSARVRDSGVLCARLFRAVAGTHQYAVLYHLTSVETPLAPIERAWSERFAAQERDGFRTLARRYVRAASAGGGILPGSSTASRR
jgi:hypothetical protein